MKKRVLSVLFALSMIVNPLPAITAHAETAETAGPVIVDDPKFDIPDGTIGDLYTFDFSKYVQGGTGKIIYSVEEFSYPYDQDVTITEDGVLYYARNKENVSDIFKVTVTDEQETSGYNSITINVGATVKPEGTVSYNTWVGGVRVYSTNKDDVLGDGTVSYVPATDDAEAKLVLNNANITVGYFAYSASTAYTAGILTKESLDIESVGTSIVELPDKECYVNQGTAAGVKVNDIHLASVAGAGAEADFNTITFSGEIFALYGDICMESGKCTMDANYVWVDNGGYSNAYDDDLIYKRGTVEFHREKNEAAIGSSFLSLAEGVSEKDVKIKVFNPAYSAEYDEVTLDEFHNYFYELGEEERYAQWIVISEKKDIESVAITGFPTDYKVGDLINDSSRYSAMKVDSPQIDWLYGGSVVWYVMKANCTDEQIQDLDSFMPAIKRVAAPDERFESGQVYVCVINYGADYGTEFAKNVNVTINEKTTVYHKYSEAVDNYLNVLYVVRCTPDLTINYTLPGIGDKPGDYTYSSGYKVYMNIARFDKGRESGEEPNGIWTNDPDALSMFGIDEKMSDEERDATINGIMKHLHWISKYEDQYDYEVHFRVTGNQGSDVTAAPDKITVNGVNMKFVFSRDGFTNETINLEPHVHKYTATTTKATTTTNGKIVNKCSVCGKTTTTTIYYPKTITLSATSYTYDGKAHKPTVTVKDSNGKTIAATNYTVSYINSAGTTVTSPINAGTYKVRVAFKGNYSGTKDFSYTINKKTGSTASLSYTSKAYTGSALKPTVTVKNASGTVLKSGTDYTVAYLNAAGKSVTPTAVGTYTVKVTMKGNYGGTISKTYKIVPKTTTIGTPVIASDGITVKWTKNTSCTGYYIYRSVNGATYTKVKTITSSATVSWKDTTAKTNGNKYQYKIVAYKTVSGKTYTSAYSDVKTIYFVSRPAISSLTNSAAGKMLIKWARNAKASGYQIQYSTSSSFTSPKSVTATGTASTLSKTIGSLTKGKTYYVRIRSYKTVGSTKYYSAWSATKSIKIVK